jgi:hypothetical protein
MKKMFTTLSLGIILFTSCSKDETDVPQLTPNFTASVSGQSYSFEEPILAASNKQSDGSYELAILGERKITADSSTQIRFVIPDFRKSGLTQQTIHLSTNYPLSGFIEYIKTAGSLKGAFNFYQSGQLQITSHNGEYIDGTFSFTYFKFDKYANKIGEVTVTNGSFANVKVQQN